MTTPNELRQLPGRTLYAKALYHLHMERPGFDRLSGEARRATAKQLLRDLGLLPTPGKRTTTALRGLSKETDR